MRGCGKKCCGKVETGKWTIKSRQTYLKSRSGNIRIIELQVNSLSMPVFGLNIDSRFAFAFVRRFRGGGGFGEPS